MPTELKTFGNSSPTSHPSWYTRSATSLLPRIPCRYMVSHSSNHHLTKEMDPFWCCCIVPASMWHYLSRHNTMTNESVSVIHLDSFPRIDEFYHKRTLRCNRKPEIFKHARKTRWFKPSMPQRLGQSGPNLHEQRAHSKYQVESTRHEKWIWITYSPTGNVTLNFLPEMWTFWFPELDGHFRCNQNQERLCRVTSDLWRPRICFKSVIGDPQPSAGLSYDSTWMFHCLIEPQLIGFNIRSNASDFAQLRLAKNATLFSYVAQMSQHNGFRWVIVQWVLLCIMAS